MQQRQLKANKLDLALNTILNLIEKYGTPLHVIVQRSMKEDNSDDDGEVEDSDLEDYDNQDEKDWIMIMDNEDLLQQQQQQQSNTSDIHCREAASMFELQQRRPLICIRKWKYIRPIQRQLKSKHYLLLKVYNGNTFYLSKTSEMKQKVFEHMAHTGAYLLKNEYSNSILRFCVRMDLSMMIQRVTTLLDNLQRNNCITIIQSEQMYVEKSKVQMDYLTFQPDIRQVCYLFVFFSNYSLSLLL